MSDEDVIWIAKLPAITVDDDGVEFTIISGKHETNFRMPRKNARKIANLILALLDEPERRTNNVRTLSRKQPDK